MKKAIQHSLMILLICASSIHAEENIPPAFEASFKIFRSGSEVAEMHRSLSSLANGEFIYRSETNSIGLVSIFYKLHILEESRWHIQDHQLQPLEYNYERIKKKVKRHKKTVFDWRNNQAYIVDNETKLTLDLKSGMTDKLLYEIEIMRDLKMGRHPNTYSVIDGAKIKTYYFDYLGEEIVDTLIGQLNTVKIVRRKPGEKAKTILWCANELHYLPIKLESTDDDGAVTIAVINKLTGMLLPQEDNSSTQLFD